MLERFPKNEYHLNLILEMMGQSPKIFGGSKTQTLFVVELLSYFSPTDIGKDIEPAPVGHPHHHTLHTQLG